MMGSAKKIEIEAQRNSNVISDPTATLFTTATLVPAPRRDPLVLDLDGDGIESVGLNAINPL
ncbi:hypothetical protein OY671_011012, partial [Metschnikowia pulcherrima]